MTDPTPGEYVQIIVLGNNAASVFDFALEWAKAKGWNVEGQDNIARIVVSVTGPPVITIEPPHEPPIVTPPAWYTTLAVGTHLKVLRPLGLMVYLDSGLINAWKRGRLPIGDTGMRLAQLYDPAKDSTPPMGVLCVLLPSPPDFPAGLWIAAMGNDGQPNVAAV